MIDILFPAALAIVAILYSAVGQGGGTGYFALMGLAGWLAPAILQPTALALNVLVSAIGCVRVCRLDLFMWRSAYPFAVLGLPFSVLGGALHIPASAYQPMVGGSLLIAGLQMAGSALATKPLDHAAPDTPPLGSLFVGGIIVLVSGVTGVGGGIFLAPLVRSLGWATIRQTAAIFQPGELGFSPCRGVGDRAALPALCMGFGASRLVDGGAAPQPSNIAAAAGFPPAYRSRANDCCLALGKRVRIRDQACHCRSLLALQCATGRRPSRRSPSQRGTDAPICM